MDIKNAFVYLIFSTLFLSGCNVNDTQIKEKESVKVVKTFNIKNNQNVKEALEYPSEIYAFQDATLAFEVSGKITHFYFEEGEKINKGDVIAELDKTIYQANYNAAIVNYRQAKSDYEKYLKLLKTNAISTTQVEKQELAVELAKSQLDIAKQNIEDTQLIAEFSGIVAKKYIEDFERITAKQPIVKLQDNSSYKVKFHIPESDILNIQDELTIDNIAKQSDFFVSVGNNDKINAELISIATTAEKSTRTFETTLQIKPKNKNILSGMTAKTVSIKKDTNEKNIFIPFKSVFTNESSNAFVWVVDQNNLVHKQNLTLGKVSNDSVEVINGLDKNATIVISGINFLNENDKIKVHEKLGG